MKIESLQSLRFVFVMLILVSHFIDGYTKSFVFGGEYGVSFFFILSGFVLSIGYGSKIDSERFSTSKFFKSRIFKLYPLHLLTMVAMITIDARIGLIPEFYKIAIQGLLLQSWIPSDAIQRVANGSSWFLCDILFFYLAFKPLYRLIMGKPLKQVLLIMAFPAVAYLAISAAVPDSMVDCFVYAFPPFRMIDFAIGIIIYRVFTADCSRKAMEWAKSCSAAKATAFEIAIIALSVAAAMVYPFVIPGIHCASMFWLTVPLTIYAFAIFDNGKGLITRLLHNLILKWLGEISFEIYMCHMILFRIVRHAYVALLGEETDLLLLFAADTAIIILASWLLQRYFATPTGSLLKKIFK